MPSECSSPGPRWRQSSLLDSGKPRPPAFVTTPCHQSEESQAAVTANLWECHHTPAGEFTSDATEICFSRQGLRVRVHGKKGKTRRKENYRRSIPAWAPKGQMSTRFSSKTFANMTGVKKTAVKRKNIFIPHCNANSLAMKCQGSLQVSDIYIDPFHNNASVLENWYMLFWSKGWTFGCKQPASQLQHPIHHKLHYICIFYVLASVWG